MKTFHTMTVIAAMTALVLGCDKKEDGGAAKATPTAAVTANSGAAPAAPASNLPVKGPWEALKITALDKKEPDGSPLFKIENLGGKTVDVIYIDFYGYDAKGKQIVHQETSFNRSIKGGASDESDTRANKDVVTWQATYHGIQFTGEKSIMDYKRAPATRPKAS